MKRGTTPRTAPGMPQTAAQLLHALEAERAHYASLYDLTPMGYLTLGVDGLIRQANRACGTLFGEAPGVLVHRSIYDFLARRDHATWKELCARLLETDEPQSRELQLSATNGTALWAQVTVTATHDADGQTTLLVTLADVTERKRDEAVMEARLRLMALAPSATVTELLRATLDEAELLTGSTIGFCHFLEADQKTLCLQAWSTNTLDHMCGAEGAGQHYSVDKAGVWVDCVAERRPVTHNDYASLPHRKGLPSGHAPVLRELVVPVLRGDLIVSILGVGNKPAEYTAEDTRVVSLLADLAWDIAEAKRAGEALKASEERLRAIADATRVGTWEWNVQTGETVFNAQWALMAGYTLDELAPVSIKTWEALGHPDELQHSTALLHRHFAGDIPYYECDIRMRHKDGHWVWIHDRGRLISRTEEGKPLLMFGTHIDITARKDAEADREAVVSHAVQMAKAASLQRMAAAVAHHFNNQMQVVIGNLELAAADMPAGDSSRNSLSDAMRAANAATTLSTLMVSYLGHTHRTHEAVDLAAACRQDLALLAQALPPGMSLTTDFPASGPTVNANAAQVQQALLNLLTNASEACVGDAVSLTRARVRLVVKTVSATDVPTANRRPFEWTPQAAQYACLEVEDSGCGMTEAEVENLFDPFYSTKFTGRGLGLPVVLGIVREHEGAVTVNSEPGRGSIFRVFLPMPEQ